jgi:hypothetical protein
MVTLKQQSVKTSKPQNIKDCKTFLWGTLAPLYEYRRDIETLQSFDIKTSFTFND